MDSKNAQGKKLSIYHLHCYPTVYLLELSSKLTVYVDESCGQGSALLYYKYFNIYVITRAGNLFICFLSESLIFCQKVSEWAICSKKWAIRSFAHLWWATWAICSWSLIFGEQPERITHGLSFLVSNLSKSLTVAPFWWATWAICSHHSEGMSDHERYSCLWQQMSNSLRKPIPNLAQIQFLPFPQTICILIFSQSHKKFIK